MARVSNYAFAGTGEDNTLHVRLYRQACDPETDIPLDNTQRVLIKQVTTDADGNPMRTPGLSRATWVPAPSESRFPPASTPAALASVAVQLYPSLVYEDVRSLAARLVEARKAAGLTRTSSRIGTSRVSIT